VPAVERQRTHAEVLGNSGAIARGRADCSGDQQQYPGSSHVGEQQNSGALPAGGSLEQEGHAGAQSRHHGGVSAKLEGRQLPTAQHSGWRVEDREKNQTAAKLRPQSARGGKPVFTDIESGIPRPVKGPAGYTDAFEFPAADDYIMQDPAAAPQPAGSETEAARQPPLRLPKPTAGHGVGCEGAAAAVNAPAAAALVPVTAGPAEACSTSLPSPPATPNSPGSLHRGKKAAVAGSGLHVASGPAFVDIELLDQRPRSPHAQAYDPTCSDSSGSMRVEAYQRPAAAAGVLNSHPEQIEAEQSDAMSMLGKGPTASKPPAKHQHGMQQKLINPALERARAARGSVGSLELLRRQDKNEKEKGSGTTGRAGPLRMPLAAGPSPKAEEPASEVARVGESSIAQRGTDMHAAQDRERLLAVPYASIPQGFAASTQNRLAPAREELAASAAKKRQRQPQLQEDGCRKQIHVKRARQSAGWAHASSPGRPRAPVTPAQPQAVELDLLAAAAMGDLSAQVTEEGHSSGGARGAAARKLGKQYVLKRGSLAGARSGTRSPASPGKPVSPKAPKGLGGTAAHELSPARARPRPSLPGQQQKATAEKASRRVTAPETAGKGGRAGDTKLCSPPRSPAPTRGPDQATPGGRSSLRDRSALAEKSARPWWVV
jgi:hypothetical protein